MGKGDEKGKGMKGKEAEKGKAGKAARLYRLVAAAGPRHQGEEGHSIRRKHHPCLAGLLGRQG